MNLFKPTYIVSTFLTAILLINGNSYAQSSKTKLGTSTKISKSSGSATNTSVSNLTPSSSDSLLNLPVKLSFESRFFGPRLMSPSDSWTAADSYTDLNKEDQQDPLRTKNTASITKKLPQDFTLSANLVFNVIHTYPGRKAEHIVHESHKDPRGFLLDDGYLAVRKNNTWQTILPGSNAFAISNEIRYYAPTSIRSYRSGSLGAGRFIFDTSLKFGKSIYSLTSRQYAQPRIQTNQVHPDSKRALEVLELYVGPQLNAQVTDSVTAWFCYEAAAHLNSLGVWDVGTSTALTDLEPGVDIQIGKHFTISPYLNWLVALPLDTTSYNLALTASL